MRNIENHFPYPHNDLNEGRVQIGDSQPHSDIIAADAAILNGSEASTEPIRRYTAPSIGGEGDVVDRKTVLMPVASEALGADEVGKINYHELQRQLGASATVQEDLHGPMHIDGRVPGQVPSVTARPHIPAGAKPSRLAEMHKQYGTER